ncbi:MutS-related protein [Hymenobacter profundi]|uniref:DNA mismatch repair protein MutS n=1 Tax=Hymenobacter profundi TaxID=1982110 RepID=A0ABS6X3Q9_9BACT|nr:DNA mismatch repair protein MutS [Hymenobacter profundi]
MPETSFRPLTVAPVDVFTENVTTHAARETYFAGRHRVVAWVRVAAFAAAGVGAYYFLSAGMLVPALAVLFALYLVFLGLVRWHDTIGYQREQHRLLAQLNRDELARLEGKLSKFDAGLRYLDAAHPYAADLDVFGAHSLYQLLNRATSRLGHDWLAGWLLAPASAAEVVGRQQAVAELAPDVAWQQEWQARARHFPQQESDPRTFTAWLRRPNFFAGKSWLKPLLIVLPVLAVGSIAGWLLDYWTIWPPVAVIGLISLLNAQFRAARDDYYQHSAAVRDALRATRDQLPLFEQRTWQAPRLRALHTTLHAGGTAASAQIGQLARIAGLFSARQTPFGNLFMNSLFAWDLQCMWRLENWKAQAATNLDAVLEASAELEALVSLAGLAFANPTYVMPELSPTELECTATQLGHPLIFARQRITNDFSMKGVGHTGVITGSNMSGKSTFLRTVGLNMVLAQAGAVVCAASMRLSSAQVYTAMRTQDNLAESTSSFYAELKRLRLLLELTSTGQPVFYLLDEILRGTNSLDRHRGAHALIHQLHQRRASGLISTHDLELAALADELPGAVQNFSFNSTIEGDEIRFDYQLTPGVCRAFNASKLMQLMGIAIEEEG